MAATAIPGSSSAFVVSFVRNRQLNLCSQPQLRFSLKTSSAYPLRRSSIRLSSSPSHIRRNSLAFAGQNVAETESKDVEEEEEDSEEEVEPGTKESNGTTAEEKSASVIKTMLLSYRDALADSDESKVTEIEGHIQSLEDEKNALIEQAKKLTEDLSKAKERFLRLNADFDNFRKRSEKERLNLVSIIQGEIIEALLPMVDNFERAKAQIKPQSEAEERIDKSYQGIYKQFVEIMKNLKVKPVDTVGKTFDPMLHEAIMREESSEFDEGIVTEEYRRGFLLGDRLLRPAMVKVSAGPGPAKAAEGEGSAPESIEGSADTTESVQEEQDDVSNEETEESSSSGATEDEP
eukprot:TRINITY_DN35421_c0_g1_i1.p1 TRINITY_DN35421_c0_g1~~TRINITY_DN35421_c0_g1_i1.p1  ORF type:complete len:348 (-),score=110.41 TRINITY_DN35421_c0_g1_i1:319-1362(-)